MFEIAIACLIITALAAWVNARFIRLPNTIGVMAIAMLISLALLIADRLGYGEWYHHERRLMESVDFSAVLMNGMLSILLFAGALHVDVSLLGKYRKQVASLALVGTAVSTLIIGFFLCWVLPMIGLPLSLGYCLLFGALISPTDPIAVTGILQSSGAPDNVSMVVSGESLFNDGVGVVLFTLLVGVAIHDQMPTTGGVLSLFVTEVGGGLLLGAVLGVVMFLMLRGLDDYSVKVLVTLAGVLGGYELAQLLHVSGPLAMVVAGLCVGYQGRRFVAKHPTRYSLVLFWKLLDEILNAVLFVLLGLEIVMVDFQSSYLLAGLVAIVVALAARLLSVGAPVAMMPRFFKLPPGAWRILTWGGLRGGISVALVLSLPTSQPVDLLLAMTYAVVVFSILVQGSTMGAVTRHALGHGHRHAAKAGDVKSPAA